MRLRRGNVHHRRRPLQLGAGEECEGPQSGSNLEMRERASAVFLFAISYETTFGSRDGDDGPPFTLSLAHSVLPCLAPIWPNSRPDAMPPSPGDTH